MIVSLPDDSDLKIHHFFLRVWVDEDVCLKVPNFPEVILLWTFYRVAYPFLRGKRQFTVFMAGYIGNLPLTHGKETVYL